MKLDIRIKSISDILTCTNIEEAKQFIGQKGYFSDSICTFDNLSAKEIKALTKVYDYDMPFVAEDDTHWRYFLPESRLKPKEKKYRPYTLMEFTEKFTVGRPIKFRRKGAEGYERYLILNGYQHEQRDGKTFTYIYIGSQGYTLDELFNAYEWQVHYTEDFEPFGVEE